jgi:hypothetical protein
MSERAQESRWHFQSEHAGLVVYHQGQKIAQFAGGEFETDDRTVAEALRGFDVYCSEVAIPPIPVVIHNAEPATQPVKPAKGRAHRDAPPGRV